MRSMKDILLALQAAALARAILVLDGEGEVVASAGLEEVECISLADRAIQQLEAVEGLSRVIGEREFNILVHDKSGDDVHIVVLSQERVLIVVFDPGTASLGAVRLQVKAFRDELAQAPLA